MLSLYKKSLDCFIGSLKSIYCLSFLWSNKCLAKIEQILRDNRIVPLQLTVSLLLNSNRIKFMFMLTLNMFTFQNKNKKKKKFHTKICFGVKDMEKKILWNHHLWLDHKFWETFDPYPNLTFFYAYKLHFLTLIAINFFFPLETIIYKSYPYIFKMKKKLAHRLS